MAEKTSKNKNWLRVVSFLMALLLWFYVVNQGDVTSAGKTTAVALQYLNVPAGLNASGPEQVSVRIWGATRVASEIQAYVDLAGYDKGVHQVPVKLADVGGALFTSVQPKQVEITLEALGERVMPIKYEIMQSPQPGFNVTQVLLSPDRCVIKGDAEVISRVVTVVAPVRLAEVLDIAMLKPQLEAHDANGNTISQGVQIVPAIINAYVVMEKTQLSKKVNVVPQFTGVIVPGYITGETVIDPAQVTILGDQARVESINEVVTKPIDITGRTADFSQAVDLVLPEGVSIVPARVNVLVKIASPPTDHIQLP
ncbi:MAG: CdaR family protein [Syntrophomonadaceae bacterium]